MKSLLDTNFKKWLAKKNVLKENLSEAFTNMLAMHSMNVISDEDNFWLIGIGCWTSLTILKGWLTPWADGSGKWSSPQSRRPITLGFSWDLRRVHSYILTWKLLAHHNQRPYHAIRSPIYGKVIPNILGFFSLQGNFPVSKDSGQLSTTI